MAQLSEKEFKRLDPIIAALFPNKQGKPELEISVLGGGITNQNFKLSPKCGEDALVVRIFGADSENLGINRQYEFECFKEAARICLRVPVARQGYARAGAVASPFTSYMPKNKLAIPHRLFKTTKYGTFQG